MRHHGDYFMVEEGDVSDFVDDVDRIENRGGSWLNGI